MGRIVNVGTSERERERPMSDRIYTDSDSVASENFVIIAEACRGVLTKRNFADGSQRSYDHVKLFNFEEVYLYNLRNLYDLSIGMISQPKKCFIRARIKDEAKSRGVVRKYNGDDATLVLEKCNWFAIDVDYKTGEYTGNLKEDTVTALLALPEQLSKSEYFAVASASYGVKPGIHMRVFFWVKYPVSGIDLKNFFEGYKNVTDTAIFNSIQIIYTAAPLGVNPVKERIIWKQPLFPKELIIPITDHQSMRGAPEMIYTKERSIKNVAAHLERIGMLAPGERHDGLIKECLPLGKAIGQGYFEFEEMFDKVMLVLDMEWSGKRDTKKDAEVVRWALNKGMESMLETLSIPEESI